MTTPAHPGRMLFVALPVADLERSKAFFAKLGFSYDPTFSGETAACMPIGEQAVVMLLARETFAQYSHRPAGDPTTHSQALYSLGVSTHEEVDTVADAALAEGAIEADGPEDLGFMYTRSFFDLDGHPWQILWMNPEAQQGTEESAASTHTAV